MRAPRPTVLLINPSYNKRETLGPFAEYITEQLPLSVGFLAGYLRAKGITAEVIDEQLYPVREEDLAARVRDQGVRIVGISVLTLTSGRAYEISAGLKRACPQVTVILGGIHVTLLPEEPLQKEIADIVVRNEGEVTLLELVERIHAGQPYDDVAGISFRGGDGIVHNPERPLIENIDALPPFPYELFEEDIDRYQFGNILTSRGCPYECIFCSQRAISGRRFRSQSPERMFSEIDRLVTRYGRRFIFINDDNFLVNKAKIRDLCERIIARKFPEDLQIGFNGRGDSLDDPALLQLMRRAHFRFVLIGFETGSERLMQMIKKGETVKQIADGVRTAKKCGFIIGGQFILGFPTETRRESLRSIRHALCLPVDSVRFNLLVPYPGTEVYLMAKAEQGAMSTDWSRYATHGGLTGEGAPYVPQGRSLRELVLLQWIGHLAFYLRPRQLFNLRTMTYATGGQVVIPEPTSWRGIVGFCRFVFRMCVFILIKVAGRR